MKKRLFIFLFSLCSVALLTGCFNSIPELDSKDESQVTLYMADALLSYDSGYESDYLTGEDYEEAYNKECERKAKLKEQLAKEEQERKAKEEQQKADQIAVNSEPMAPATYGIDELPILMGIEDIGIFYNGKSIRDIYPEVDPTTVSFALSAKEGFDFLILKFDLMSLTGSDKDVDIYSHIAGFKIKLGDDTYSVLPSAIDDFAYYSGVVSATEPTSLVMIAEIPEGTSAEDIKLIYYSKDKKSYNLDLN